MENVQAWTGVVKSGSQFTASHGAKNKCVVVGDRQNQVGSVGLLDRLLNQSRIPCAATLETRFGRCLLRI